MVPPRPVPPSPEPEPGPGPDPEPGSDPEGRSGRGGGPRRDPELLVGLLADDSPRVRAAVRRALERGGAPARDALRAASAAPEPRVRARARQLLVELDRDAGFERLAALLGRADDGRPCPLEDGLAAIDHLLGFPDASAALDGYAELVASRLGAAVSVTRAPVSVPRGRAAEVAEALRQVLGQDAGFLGPTEDYHLVDHVSLSRTVARRRGLPLTLSAVYAGVARRIGYEAGLVPFPGHVLLALGPGPARLLLDPFAGGDVVPLEAAHARLAALGAPPSDRWLTPTTDREMVVRQVRNLGAALERHGRFGEARRVRRTLDAAVR